MGPRPERRWEVLPLAPQGVFQALAAYPPLIAQLLYNRGIETPRDAEEFLRAPQGGSHEALLLPGADDAVQRIVKAIQGNERVAVYGDFDADGVTSSALLTEAFRDLGLQPLAYIPDRVSEGHGLNMEAIRFLHGQGVGLIVTADCGITDAAEVAAAADLGMDVIITDHHAPPERLPDAAALVNPKLPGTPTGLAELASVGVAFKLYEAVCLRLERAVDWSLLELVALGTIADLAPLTGENRPMVKAGIERLNSSQRPGIQELMQVARVAPGAVDAEKIGFALGPRINAPGRIDHADASYALLTARSREEAAPFAHMLETKNLERRAQTQEIVSKAQELAEAEPDAPLIFLGDPSFPPGVVGLAAGRLADRFHRPAIVYHEGPEESRASCRSIPEFNIIEALRAFDGVYMRYGGHAQAAGFTIETDRLAALKEGLVDYAGRRLDGMTLAPSLRIDAQIRLERLNPEVFRLMGELGPHGQGNQTPRFLSKAVDVGGVKTMGEHGDHMRFTVRTGGVAWDAVAFNLGSLAEGLSGPVDIVYNIATDQWGGRPRLRLNVQDLRPASG